MTEKLTAVPRTMASKVPEITVWFWIIKILCTTVGESFADWINMTVGLGLLPTAMMFTAVLIIILIWQLVLRHYVPFVYWLAVVVLSVTGTLYTDILTDKLGVPLAVSTTLFAVVLGSVFVLWFARERTLSIHSITTTPRELFYWLTVLVTFALGTAIGDWTLELTGWGPGTSVLLPAGLIAVVAAGWRLGANAVLSFWLAYVLTRPLGANLGDWLGLPTQQQGIGLGVGLTSGIFLVAILGVVAYLSVTRADVIDDSTVGTAVTSQPRRQHVLLGCYAVVAIATGALLMWTAGQPHSASSANEAETESGVRATLAPGQSATAHFPRTEVTKLRDIVGDVLVLVHAGDQAAAITRVTDLETAWDHDQSTLQPLDQAGWIVLDGQIDEVLSQVRATEPDTAREAQTLSTLESSLR